MSAKKFVPVLIFAAACLSMAWWLLREAPEQERLPASMPAQGAELPARAAESRADAAARDDELVAEPAPGDQLRAVPATGAGVSVEPIPMIEGIMLPGGMWNLHAAMERESRDVEWADQMEREFSTYFASKPELGRNFAQPSVICRSRSCEVQAIGYGPRAFDTWAAATQDLRDQPWREDMRAGGIYTIERAPNEHAVVLILIRPTRFSRDGSSEPRAVPPPK
ncbi:MAG TPA: hypothetical protein VNP02_02085 [Gammaproteobacteria bacterium]|nr:hypothetical protein [Gammaproteobacteria bacterium]